MTYDYRTDPGYYPPAEGYGPAVYIRRDQGRADRGPEYLPIPLRPDNDNGLRAAELAIDRKALSDLERLREINMGIAERAADLDGLEEAVAQQRIRACQVSSRLLVPLIKQIQLLAKDIAQRELKRGAVADFYKSQAVKVVEGVLFGMDQEFYDQKFGDWMPFSYPDQWIKFSSVLSKVLAANGLIYGKNPDVYRRLMEETPPLERLPDPRLSKPPPPVYAT